MSNQFRARSSTGIHAGPMQRRQNLQNQHDPNKEKCVLCSKLVLISDYSSHVAACLGKEENSNNSKNSSYDTNQLGASSVDHLCLRPCAMPIPGNRRCVIKVGDVSKAWKEVEIEVDLWFTPPQELEENGLWIFCRKFGFEEILTCLESKISFRKGFDRLCMRIEARNGTRPLSEITSDLEFRKAIQQSWLTPQSRDYHEFNFLVIRGGLQFEDLPGQESPPSHNAMDMSKPNKVSSTSGSRPLSVSKHPKAMVPFQPNVPQMYPCMSQLWKPRFPILIVDANQPDIRISISVEIWVMSHYGEAVFSKCWSFPGLLQFLRDEIRFEQHQQSLWAVVFNPGLSQPVGFQPVYNDVDFQAAVLASATAGRRVCVFAVQKKLKEGDEDHATINTSMADIQQGKPISAQNMEKIQCRRCSRRYSSRYLEAHKLTCDLVKQYALDKL